MRSSVSRTAAATGIAAVLALTAACGSSNDETTAAPNNDPTSSSVAPAGDEPFGDGCAAVPADGAGSFSGMSSDPVATAASNNPVLSTLVAAVGAADLGDTLNSAEDITVFAPANAAFEAIPKKDVSALLKDKDALTSVLTYHVVQGKLAPEDLAGMHKTLQGDSLEVKGSGEEFTVNGSSNIVCGNVQTANATVYIIDGLLMPSA